jgi:hypothetical protein
MIPDGHKQNFATLCDAARTGRIVLLECTSAADGRPVYVVGVTNHEGGDVEIVPVAKFFDGSPYDEVLPPEV